MRRGREEGGNGQRRGRKGEGNGKGDSRDGEVGRLKGGEREGKGKEREGEGSYFNFCSFGSFRNGFEIPKQTERVDNILSEKIPKQNRNYQYFGLFQFEPNPFRRQDILMAYHVQYSNFARSEC